MADDDDQRAPFLLMQGWRKVQQIEGGGGGVAVEWGVRAFPDLISWHWSGSLIERSLFWHYHINNFGSSMAGDDDQRVPFLLMQGWRKVQQIEGGGAVECGVRALPDLIPWWVHNSSQDSKKYSVHYLAETETKPLTLQKSSVIMCTTRFFRPSAGTAYEFVAWYGMMVGI